MRVLIAFFSGTGSTAMAARCFEKSLKDKGCQTEVVSMAQGEPCSDAMHDMLLVLYPVHAFNAPASVYKWIEKMPDADHIPAAVISVSGGGEISPNTACRVNTIKKLEKKGYNVFYENMLVMPSNIFASTKAPLAQMLIKVLPERVMAMAGQIALHERRKTKPLLFDKGMSRMGELEKRFSSIFGKHIKVSPSCTGCGKCARDCPSGNITMADGKPVFSNKCLLCMKCLYECPQNAIAPKYAKFFVLKDGFPMEQWAKADIQMDKNELDKAAKGYFWSGVRKYLQEQDKSI